MWLWRVGHIVASQVYIPGIGVVDKYLPEENTVIEVDGDYFHCHPKDFKPEDYNKRIKMIAGEKWSKDRVKTKR